MDNSGQVDVIYMDFMKAFDQVPHQRLLHKVKSYGIDGHVLVVVEYDNLAMFDGELLQRTEYKIGNRPRIHGQGWRC